MPYERIEFVDSISPTATIRLSFADPWRVLFNGTDVSPPPFRRAVVSSLLADGSIIPAASYDNRVVTLHLQLRTSVPETAASQIQVLRRELDRSTNILRWQPEPKLPPVYFKTFRAPDTTDVIDHGIGVYEFTVSIPAEPFTLGHREDLATAVVSNDPNAGSNGRFFDITSNVVKGDVETPLRITIAGASLNARQSCFAVRRRGTPSAAPFVLQAESMTQGTDTSVVATSDTGATPAGAASNSSSTSFATNNLSVTRLSTTAFPSTPSVDVRGTYRIFARIRSTSTTTFKIQLEHGLRAVLNSAQTAPLSTITFSIVDLGLVQMPEGVDPVTDGPGGLPLSVTGVPLVIHAQRTVGSGPLIWDYIVAVPADDKLCYVYWGGWQPTNYVLDGTSRSVYGLDASNRIADIGGTSMSGDFPMVSPGVSNRIVFLRDVTPSAGNGLSDDPTTTTTINCSYWPRYLAVRPVTS